MIYYSTFLERKQENNSSPAFKTLLCSKHPDTAAYQYQARVTIYIKENNFQSATEL
jgi:hypothetical protein